MATDTKDIIKRLTKFYCFENKTIISVGAGGGQLIEYGRSAQKVFALDCDCRAITSLREQLKTAGLEEKFKPILGDFFHTTFTGDTVLFEFCLHEMVDPAAAIKRAQQIAPDVLIIDHLPKSEWAYYAAEETKVEASWKALRSFPFAKYKEVTAVQAFNHYEDICNKLRIQGRESMERIRRFVAERNFSIPMPYAMALISSR
jgi:hypothetical protein